MKHAALNCTPGWVSILWVVRLYKSYWWSGLYVSWYSCPQVGAGSNQRLLKWLTNLDQPVLHTRFKVREGGGRAERGNFSFFFPLINWLAAYTFAGLINGSHVWDQPHVQDKLKSLPGEQQEVFPWYDFNYVQYHHLSVVCNVRTSTYTILHANTVSCAQRFFTWLVYACEGLPVAYPNLKSANYHCSVIV